MPTAEEAAAANLAWRAVNLPSSVTSAEQAQAAQYSANYYNVERPAQQARDAAIQNTIYANRQMINAQEGLSYGGTHTQPQLAALYGSAERGRQAYAAEDEYYDANPSAAFQNTTSQYEASRNRMVGSQGSYAATGELVLNTTAGEGGFTGRAAQYKSAFDREVYGIGAPDNEREYYRRQAEIATVERPGYTAPSDLGDTQTQKMRQGYGMFQQAMGIAGNEVASDYQMTGKFIEAQRQAAYATPERRDERFFMGELQKWAEVPVEKASAYHDIGMKSGERIPANPFEYQADLAVEFLKGSPNKASEYFSPVSGEMSKQLPGGQGVQEFAWDEAITDYKRQNVDARTPYPEQVSFMKAVTYMGAAEGKYGPYGKLYGGIDNGGVDLTGGRTRGGNVVGGNALITGEPVSSSPKVMTADMAFTAMRSQAIGFVNVALPGASNLFPTVQREKEVAVNQFGAAIAAGDIGGAYGAAEKFAFAVGPTRSLPDITGIDTNISIKESELASGALTFGASATKQVYTDVRDNPIQDIGLVLLPGAFKVGEAAITKGIAITAMSKVPYVSTAGRLASTPLAADIGTYGIKGGLVGLYAYESGMSVVRAEGIEAKGKAFGTVAYQVGGMTIGSPLASSLKFRTPVNDYAGKEFFSGKVAMSPVEKAAFKAETTARSFVSANRGAYLDVSVITKFGRFEEPMLRATPAIERTTLAGPYAKPIRGVLAEQEHSMIGSSTVRQQYTKPIAEEFGLREGKDVDVLFSSPQKAITSLTQRTGLSEEAARGVMDTHPIPQNYPRFKPSKEVDITTDESSFASRIFGDPYRRIATPRTQSEVIVGKEYGGLENYEAVQVQYGRKAAAVAAVIESPITKGYRAEKDIYDFVGLYRAQRKVSISRGTAVESFAKSDAAMNRFLERDITVGTVKGQNVGDVNPIRKVKVSQLYEEGKIGMAERPASRYEPETGYIPRASRSYTLSSRGAAYLIGSTFTSSLGSATPSKIESRFGSSRSTPSSPSNPLIRSSIMGSSSQSPSPSRSFISSFVDSPVGSPPSRMSFTGSPPPTYNGTPSVPPSITPPATTYSPPSSPPYNPPVSPPTSTPPSSPPYSPPTSNPPPFMPPSVPRIPAGFLPGGGGGYGQKGNLGVTRWQRDNLVATKEYLGRGIAGRDFGFADDRQSPVYNVIFGGKKSKRKKNPFGF